MAETLIFAAAEIIEIGLINAGLEGGAIAIAEGTTFGVANTTLIAGGLALGASIGLAYAIRPDLPKPQDGTQAIKQSVQPRQRGYWDCRLAGAVVLFESNFTTSSYAGQINAFHHGEIESLLNIIFDDEYVATNVDLNTNASSAVTPVGTKYANTTLSLKKGLPTETADALFVGTAEFGAVWNSSFIGHGVAHLGMVCRAPVNAEDFANMYPRGLPHPSVVARCSKTWDPRTGVVAASPNPVVQLIDYLTREDGGCGYPLAEILPPAVLEQWKVEANLCDVDLGGGNIRYRSAGWYKFDNKPEDVINHMLSACDGWMADAGDGTLALVVGVYREPVEPALTEQYILDCTLNYGAPDEQLVNQVDITWTNPAQKFAEDQTTRSDQASIDAVGAIRSQGLDLTWVQWGAQVNRLGDRALLRLNPRRSGVLTTTLYGMRYLGKRWVKLQYPSVSDLADCVIEIQGAEVDLLGGTVSFSWILVDPVALAAL